MEEKIVNPHGTYIWTVGQGHGFPLILISGGPGCSDYMAPVASLLGDSVKVIRFDPRGCGRSEYQSDCDLSTAISDLEYIRKFYGIEEWIVAGHSWGADLALAYTLEYPKVVKALIYMCGTGIQRDIDWKEAYKKGMAENLEITPVFEYPFNTEIKRSLLTAWRNFIKTPNLLRDISAIQTEALFITGSQDIRPTWPVEQISHLIKNAEYRVIEDAGHYIWLTHAKQLEDMIKKYIRDILE